MAVDDAYPGQDSATSCSRRWEALTPSDTDNFTFLPKAIRVGAVSGSFVAVGDDGNPETFYGIAGTTVEIRPIRINETGLTPSMTFIGLK